MELRHELESQKAIIERRISDLKKRLKVDDNGRILVSVDVGGSGSGELEKQIASKANLDAEEFNLQLLNQVLGEKDEMLKMGLHGAIETLVMRLKSAMSSPSSDLYAPERNTRDLFRHIRAARGAERALELLRDLNWVVSQHG